MKTVNSRELIYLAGLLHDIGKFYQRADPSGLDRSSALAPSIKALEKEYCPQWQGFYSHKHVIWTAQFIAEQKLEKRFVHPEWHLMPLSAKHHAPSSFAEKIIQKADHLSSGADRTEKGGQADAEAEKKTHYKNVRMRSVFEAAMKEDKSIAKEGATFPYRYSLPLKPLGLEESHLPKLDSEWANTKPDYASLWQEFSEQCQLITAQDFRAYTDSLTALLEVYTSTIPSSTMHLPDVSLYDHLISTASLSLLLWDYQEAHGLGQLPQPSEEFGLLIGADLSGIQSYIYDIISKNASKNLKGRSYSLQLLLDSVLDTLKEELSLFRGNLVYNSGGSFYLLAANTEANRDKLGELRERINEQVYQRYGTKLFVALDWQSFSGDDLIYKAKGHNLVDVWKSLSEKLNGQKRRRFSDRIIQAYDDLFEPGEAIPKEERDAITGEAILGKAVEKDGLKFSAVSAEQIELGQKLNQADFRFGALQNFRTDSKTRFKALGQEADDVQYSLEHAANDLRITGGDGGELLAINRSDFLKALPQGAGLPKDLRLGFSFFGGNRIPQIQNKNGQWQNKTFEELPRQNSHSQGKAFSRLGILRMDVDNLGTLFIRGLDESRRTFSRLSSLSRQLDWFFKGYINTILAKLKEQFDDSLYVIYSGGDDLFVIGDWQATLAFAKKIKEDFARFSCHNDELSLSGGIVLVPSTYPIMRSAELAAQAEKRAKNHQLKLSDGQLLSKNAICLFGQALHWEHEFKVVESLKNDLVSLIDDHHISRSLLGRILSFKDLQDQSLKAEKEGARPDFRYRYTIAYNLSQFIASLNAKSQKSPAALLLDKLKADFFVNNQYRGKALESEYSFIDLAAIAARWAELELRSAKF